MPNVSPETIKVIPSHDFVTTLHLVYPEGENVYHAENLDDIVKMVRKVGDSNLLDFFEMCYSAARHPSQATGIITRINQEPVTFSVGDNAAEETVFTARYPVAIMEDNTRQDAILLARAVLAI